MAASREDDPLERIRVCNASGVQCLHAGALDEAEALFTEVNALFGEAGGSISPTSRATLQRAIVSNRACLLKKMGRPAEAVRWMDVELDMDTVDCPSTLATYAACLTAAGECDAAIAVCRRGIARLQQQSMPHAERRAFDKEVFVGLFYNLAAAQVGSPAERHFADSSFHQAVHFSNLFLGPDHPTTTAIKANLATHATTQPTPPPRRRQSSFSRRSSSRRNTNATPSPAPASLGGSSNAVTPQRARHSVTEQMLYHPIMYPRSEVSAPVTPSVDCMSFADSHMGTPVSTTSNVNWTAPAMDLHRQQTDSLMQEYLAHGQTVTPQLAMMDRPTGPVPLEFSVPGVGAPGGATQYQHRWRRASEPEPTGGVPIATPGGATGGQDLPVFRSRSELTLPSIDPAGWSMVASPPGGAKAVGGGKAGRGGAGLQPRHAAPGHTAKQQKVEKQQQQQQLRRGPGGTALDDSMSRLPGGSVRKDKKAIASAREAQAAGRVVSGKDLKRMVPAPPGGTRHGPAPPQLHPTPKHPMNYPLDQSGATPGSFSDSAMLPPLPRRGHPATPDTMGSTPQTPPAAAPAAADDTREQVIARRVETNPRTMSEIRREVKGISPTPPPCTPLSPGDGAGSVKSAGGKGGASAGSVRKSRFSGQRAQRQTRIEQQALEEQRRLAELSAEAERQRRVEEVQSRVKQLHERRREAAAVAIQRYYRCHLQAQELTKQLQMRSPTAAPPETPAVVLSPVIGSARGDLTFSSTPGAAGGHGMDPAWVSTAAIHRKYLGMTGGEEQRYTTAVLRIQATWRMRLARQHVRALLRQRAGRVRAYLAFEKRSVAAKAIQRVARGWLSRRHQRMEYLRGPGEKIVRWFRKYRVLRKATRRERIRLRTCVRAATKIQRAWRRHYQGLIEADRRLRLRMAAVAHPDTHHAVIIQRTWRGYVARRQKLFLLTTRRVLRDEVPLRADIMDEETDAIHIILSEELEARAFLLKYLRYKPRVPQANAFIAECRERQVHYMMETIHKPYIQERFSHKPLRTQLYEEAVRTERLEAFVKRARIVVGVLRLQRVLRRWLKMMSPEKRILNQRWKDREWVRKAKEERLRVELLEFRMAQNALHNDGQQAARPPPMPHPLSVGHTLSAQC